MPERVQGDDRQGPRCVSSPSVDLPWVLEVVVDRSGCGLCLYQGDEMSAINAYCYEDSFIITRQADQINRLKSDRAALLDRIVKLEGMVPRWCSEDDLCDPALKEWDELTCDEESGLTLMVPPIPLPELKGGE